MPHILVLVNDEFATVDNGPTRRSAEAEASTDDDVIDDGQLAWAITFVLLEHGRCRCIPRISSSSILHAISTVPREALEGRVSITGQVRLHADDRSTSYV